MKLMASAAQINVMRTELRVVKLEVLINAFFSTFGPMVMAVDRDQFCAVLHQHLGEESATDGGTLGYLFACIVHASHKDAGRAAPLVVNKRSLTAALSTLCVQRASDLAMTSDLVYAAFDEDGNGTLEKEEIRDFLSIVYGLILSLKPRPGEDFVHIDGAKASTPRATSLADVVTTAMFETIDTDGSGGIDRDEFMHWLLNVTGLDEGRSTAALSPDARAAKRFEAKANTQRQVATAATEETSALRSMVDGMRAAHSAELRRLRAEMSDMQEKAIFEALKTQRAELTGERGGGVREVGERVGRSVSHGTAGAAAAAAGGAEESTATPPPPVPTSSASDWACWCVPKIG